MRSMPYILGPLLLTLLGGCKEEDSYLGDHAAFAVATPALGDILVRAPKHSTALTEQFAPGDAVALGWASDEALALAED